MRPLATLVPYARNARKHSPAQVDKIAASMREWGWTNPILVDEHGGIIAGHGRLLAAQKLGLDEAPCMVARGWTDAQRRAYVIADNQLALEAGWDREMLSLEVADLAALDFNLELTGFGDLEIKSLLGRGDEIPEDADKVPDRPEDPVSSPGDQWMLGVHRLLCGDATDQKCVARLLAGDEPRLMVTDPPYGVDYDPAWRHAAGVNRSQRTGKVENDDRHDWTETWRMFPGDVAYVWHADRYCGAVAAHLHEAGLEIRSQIIWAKSRFTLSRGNYHWQHEPCWYAVRRGAKAHWIGDRSQSTVWAVDVTDDGDESKHGTQKPLECMGRPMRHHDAPLVFDPFLGTGTTLIAAHLQGRTCLGLEIDPGYADVIVGRWQAHSGLEATLDGDGRTFAQVAAERPKTRRKKRA
jgi:DNA modification methylase